MAYKLIITEKADELIDSSVSYIINKLKNPQAALNLIDSISGIYGRLEDDPFQFPESRNEFLKQRGYREALTPGLSYRIVFRVENMTVYIVGLFHDLEDHSQKITEQE